jgi:quercetin dioxygenase-like cupin family protein
MRGFSNLAVTLGAATVVALVSTTAVAQNAYPVVDILKTGKTVVDEPIVYPTSGAAQVTASIVTVAPNAETVFHRHGVPMFGYILEGTLTVDYGEKGTRVYKPGDSLVEAMAVTHRGMNLGTDLVKILAVYMGAEGAKNVVLEPAK